MQTVHGVLKPENSKAQPFENERQRKGHDVLHPGVRNILARVAGHDGRYGDEVSNSEPDTRMKGAHNCGAVPIMTIPQRSSLASSKMSV